MLVFHRLVLSSYVSKHIAHLFRLLSDNIIAVSE